MLILGRYEGESIIVGEGPDEARIVVLSINDEGLVRLGIEAPVHVPVDRVEVRIAKDRARQEANRRDP